MFASQMFPLLMAVLLGAPRDDKPEPAPVKPSAERQAVGTFHSPGQLLARRARGEWELAGVNQRVWTADALISLPGYRSELRLASKVDLLLWGNLPELLAVPILESSVTLHHTGGTKLDADLTVHRGRIFLTNRKEKGPAQVRLRFASEVWDVTLESRDTVVGFESFSLYAPEQKGREGEEPVRQANLYVAKGEAQLKAGPRTFGDLSGPTGRALVAWSNGQGLSGPHRIDREIPEWKLEDSPPKEAEELAKKLRAALAQQAVAVAEAAAKGDSLQKAIEKEMGDTLKEKPLERRMLAVRSLGAVDAIGPLLDLLETAEARTEMRGEALFALRNWLSRGPEQLAKLHDPKKKEGLLLARGYSNAEAQIIADLLFAIPLAERQQKETFAVLIEYLRHKKVLVRTLAHSHLSFLVPFEKIAYNPGGPAEDRVKGHEAWKKLLDAGKLPPAPK